MDRWLGKRKEVSGNLGLIANFAGIGVGKQGWNSVLSSSIPCTSLLVEGEIQIISRAWDEPKETWDGFTSLAPKTTKCPCPNPSTLPAASHKPLAALQGANILFPALSGPFCDISEQLRKKDWGHLMASFMYLTAYKKHTHLILPFPSVCWEIRKTTAADEHVRP